MKGQVLGTFATRLAVKAGVRQRQQAALPLDVQIGMILFHHFLLALLVTFDGFIETSKPVSPSCLFSFERNRYSVRASFSNPPVSLRIYPNRLVPSRYKHAAGVTRPRATSFREHLLETQRSYKLRPRTIYDWLHYLAVVQRAPCELRNGSFFLE